MNIASYIIDNEGDRLNIDAPREDIGCNENFCKASPESIDDDVALCRLESSRQTGDLVTFVIETSLYRESGFARL